MMKVDDEGRCNVSTWPTDDLPPVRFRNGFFFRHGYFQKSGCVVVCADLCACIAASSSCVFRNVFQSLVATAR